MNDIYRHPKAEVAKHLGKSNALVRVILMSLLGWLRNQSRQNVEKML